MNKVKKAPDAAVRWIHISFPVSQEFFISYQERAMGRKMTEMEQGTALAWLSVLNMVGAGELDGNEVVERLDQRVEEATTLPARHFIRAVQYWLSLAMLRPPHGPEGGPAPVPCPAP